PGTVVASGSQNRPVAGATTARSRASAAISTDEDDELRLMAVLERRGEPVGAEQGHRRVSDLIEIVTLEVTRKCTRVDAQLLGVPQELRRPRSITLDRERTGQTFDGDGDRPRFADALGLGEAFPV